MDDPSAPEFRALGRPASYRPEYAEQAKKLCELGATDIEIAGFFDVSDRTIYRWQLKYPEFCQALKSGKVAADERVERSLYHKAVGYTFESEKVFQFQGNIVRTPYTEHVPPDTTAMIFWLKNRRPEAWRDKREVLVQNESVESWSDEEIAAALATVRSQMPTQPVVRSAKKRGQSGETVN